MVGLGEMDWRGALDANVGRYGHPRWRWLCSDDNPDADSREKHRALMVRIAAGEPRPAPPRIAVDYGTGEPGARPCGGCPGW
jgi:hypothetical protein